MIYVSTILVILAVLVSAANIAGNLAALLRRRKGIRRRYSSVPLVSLLCCLGGWGFSRDVIGLWAFLPALLDPGTWILLALPWNIIDNIRNPRCEANPDQPDN